MLNYLFTNQLYLLMDMSTQKYLIVNNEEATKYIFTVGKLNAGMTRLRILLVNICATFTWPCFLRNTSQ